MGFMAWQVKTPLLRFIENFGLSADMAGALIMGLSSSMVMVLGVLLWSFLSSK